MKQILLNKQNVIVSSLMRVDVLLFIFTCGLFILVPKIDLWVGGLFYRPDVGFIWKDNVVVYFIYQLFGKIHYIELPLILLLLVGNKIFPVSRMNIPPRKMLFLLLVLLVGPGFLVNYALKENSTGRSRPRQVEEFGGQHQFTAPFVVANQCNSNCSFVSGHAAIGFYLIALGWVFHSRLIFAGGLLIGVTVGVVRMIQGGHFLSDIVFSFWTVYFTAVVFAKIFQLELDKDNNSDSDTKKTIISS